MQLDTSGCDFSGLYTVLNAEFGFLNWWPAESREEVVAGAILTQQASWKNVETAIQNLKNADVLNVKSMAEINLKTLESLVKPSGFYRQKARRLKNFMNHVYKKYHTLDNFFDKTSEELRLELLELEGVGKETADSILLYAAEKPVFVIDAYTLRIVERIYGFKMDYDDLQKLIESRIERRLSLYKDFHAQFVELGKRFCKTKPICEGCPASVFCKFKNKNSKNR